MASAYTGSSYPPVSQDAPSPAPAPGIAPVVNIPADGDANNSSTMFQQQYKTIADQLAAPIKALAPCPAVALNTTTAGIGFSPITQVGAGTGTVAPSGTGYGGQNVVILIILGGVVTTATYQYSLDGGATYSATLTTAASVTLGASGIVVAFAGTFIATNTYQFKCAFAPMLRAVDVAGNGRFLVDHNGIDTGSRILRLDEMWRKNQTPASATPVGGHYPHQFSRTGTTSVYSMINDGTNQYGVLLIDPTATNASGDTAYLFETAVTANNAGYIAVCEFDLFASAVGVNGLDIYAGLSNGDVDTASYAAYVKLPSGAASVWQLVTNRASVLTTVSTGVTATAAWTRFKLELHGAGTPLATAITATNGVALLFVNDVLAAASITNIPSGQGLRWVMGYKTTAINVATTLKCSPYAVRVVRQSVVV